MAYKVLVTDKVHSLLLDGLSSDLGCEVVYDTTVDNNRLDTIIHLYDGIVINSKILMDQERISRGRKLRFIGRLGSGMEIVDVAYACEKGIGVYNSPEGNCNAVAEHAMGMLLCLMHRICLADREVRRLQWNREPNRGTELKGKTVGIIGLGHTGGSFASKLASWGVRVLAYDKYREDFPTNLSFVTHTDLASLQSESDIISLHLPLTHETEQMVNATFLNHCKKGVILVNTSRGLIVNTDDLLTALVTQQVGGACLDVFENEKPDTFSFQEKEKYSQLYAMDNVILTPHIAGWTHESLEGIASILLEKIKSGNHFSPPE